VTLTELIHQLQQVLLRRGGYDVDVAIRVYPEDDRGSFEHEVTDFIVEDEQQWVVIKDRTDS
jgi:hypothetical protein